MATIEKLHEGQILHDYHRQGGSERHWKVVVLKVDVENKKAFCSWNCNTPRWVSDRTISRWKVKEKKARKSNGKA